MRAYIDAFSCPKAGNSDSELEDAFSAESGEFHGNGLAVAIADGASESFLAGRWAQRLTRAYRRHAKKAPEDLLTLLVERWPRTVAAYKHWRKVVGRPLNWFEEPKLELGAHAAFLGFQLIGDEEGKWEAFSVGDACLFQVRDDQLLTSFPLKGSDEFDLTPPLVSSRREDLSGVIERITRLTGDWIPGDSLYLMTDAAAAWFLSEVETDGRPWHLLRNLKTDAMPPFVDWIEELRRDGRLKNDDVTILRIELD